MPETPRYPGRDADTDEGEPRPARSGRVVLLWLAAAVVLVVLFVVLHLTGVLGPGEH